ncbi:MAG: ABC transporter permease [Candidatus Baldrarchaeia archaeon]
MFHVSEEKRGKKRFLELPEETRRNLGFAIYVIRHNVLTLIGFVLLTLMVLLAIFAPYIAPYNPVETSKEVLLPPDIRHPFGTDEFGRDILSRCLYAARADLYIALIAMLISFTAGSTIGAVVGYYEGPLDEVIMRLIDILMAFPGILLAMGIMAFLGPTAENLILASSIIRLPMFVRLTRGQIISVKKETYTDAAKVCGLKNRKIIFSELLPNAIPPVISFLCLALGRTIITIAALSYVGLGIRPPEPEWGVMAAEGSLYILFGEWWLSFFPGFFILITSMSLILVGEGLMDILDPRRRLR